VKENLLAAFNRESSGCNCCKILCSWIQSRL